jgi:hypothetical protein
VLPRPDLRPGIPRQAFLPRPAHISAEKYPSLDKYTGMNIDEFMDILAGIYDEKGAKPAPEP